MRSSGLKTPNNRVQIKIPDAKFVLECYLNFYLNLYGKKTVWIPEYDKVAEWLEDNNGLGLFMYGNCGRGKTFLARYVLPAILFEFCHLIVRVAEVQEMNRDIDSLLNRKIIAVDDIGTESLLNDYGNKRLAFAEVMDAVEKDDKLIIVTTNLDFDDIVETYGERIGERIKEMTKRVAFRGDSFRGK